MLEPIPPVLCINSTLAVQEGFVSNGTVSPIHDWGFVHLPQHTVIGHRFNRYEVVLRSRIGGLDIGVLFAVLRGLLKGCRRIYLVSVPDLLVALPLLRRLFPNVQIVTWAWVGADVTRNLAFLRACDHVFCLTQGAVSRMTHEGLGSRASLQFWGADPGYYGVAASTGRFFDVCLLGQTLRDLESAVSAMKQGGFSVVTTERVRLSLEGHLRTVGTPPELSVRGAENHADVVDIFRRARVSWVPLRAGDVQPTGYTNLAESLLCGTPVVIADSSTIPAAVLTLPGVFRYRTGDASDLVFKPREALQAASSPDYAQRVFEAAARLLDGQALAERLRQLLL